MVNITAMLSNLPAGAVSDIARPQGSETPGIEGFTQLLALQLAGFAPDAAPLADTAPALPAASILPDSGNILPVGLAALPGGLPGGLPGSLPGALAEELPLSEEPASEPVLIALPAFPALLSLPIIPLALAAPQGEGKPTVMPQTKPMAAPQIAPTPTAPAEATAATKRLLPITPSLPAELAAAQAISLAPLVLPAAASATFQVQVRPRGPAPTLAPAASTEATVAQTAPATLDLLRPKAAASETLPVAPLTPALSAMPFDVAPAQNAPATAPALPAPAGHDFAALVDRLVEARDAVRPQSVEAAITTAEFGQVALRFAADDAGLSVTMASADPEFARAAQAAQAVSTQAASIQSASVQPAAQTQSGSDASAQGQGTAPHSEQRGQGQSGHQPRERLANQRMNSRNAPRGDTADDSPQRSGIFA